MQLIGFFFDYFAPNKLSGMKGVELEGERPSFWVFIVAFEDASATQMLPLVYGFFDGFYIE